ncbi:DUF6584 family protein [uncultured Streptomyces sp.]|uniref:DUF6584 family protein n=1 Tax=uncultured Streptomyces sp. TaxID=174707 RepID=UPI00260D3A33|nr:DUF6584 family protein [uncultured Streptomyces sp.]
MALARTLERVDTDLAAGRLPVARQRLRGLVSSYPQDRGVRRRLAEVYRLFGEPAEAGRWAYLEEDSDPRETAAFEERHPDPVRRMRAIGWRGQESAAHSPFAEARLASLRTAAEKRLGRSVDWDTLAAAGPEGSAVTENTPAEALGFVGCLVLVVAAAAIWVNGLVDLFD